MENETRLYGVSFGNGNDGVSHMFADYYVRTNAPYRLARAAMVGEFKAGAGHKWAMDNLEIDGEAECTIYATISEPPAEESEDNESEENNGSWSEANGAWMICEVFPEEEPRDGAMLYDSIEEALSADVLELVKD